VGRLFLFTQLPDTYQKVADYAIAHGERISAVEQSTLGISHDEVGLELARLWQFPEALESFISGHDGPFDDKSQPAVMAVHAAHVQVEPIFKVSMDSGRVDPFVDSWLDFGDFDWIALRNETAKRIEGQFEMLTQVAA
jgi:HD-like signal output (HDOD) protein